MNVKSLQDKGVQYVAKSLTSILGAIVIFASLVDLFGYLVTALLTLVGALALWIVAGQAVERVSPQVVGRVSPEPTNRPPPENSTSAIRTRAKLSPILEPPILHQVCDVGPYEVEAGEIRSILLNAKQGQKVKGHLEEVDGQPFDWYIADEKNMILLKKGERRKFKLIEEGLDERAYTVNRKIPWGARWFLILDTYGKVNGRKVRVDFEPVANIQ